MNLNNSGTTYVLEIPDMQIKQIIDYTCFLLGILARTPDFNQELRACMSEIKKRTGVELEDLNELLSCVKDLKSSPYNPSSIYIEYRDKFIADKCVAISKEMHGLIEDHYNIDGSSNKVQVPEQEITSASSNETDLKDFGRAETSTKAAGEADDIDDGFVLLG